MFNRDKLIVKVGGIAVMKNGQRAYGYTIDDDSEEIPYCMVDWDYYLSLIKKEDWDDVDLAVKTLFEHGVIAKEVFTGAWGVKYEWTITPYPYVMFPYFFMRVYAEEWLDCLIRNAVLEDTQSFVYEICWRPQDKVVTPEERDAWESDCLRIERSLEGLHESGRRTPWNPHGDFRR